MYPPKWVGWGIGGIVTGFTAGYLYCQNGEEERTAKDDLPRDKHGVPIPESKYPHTQLGEKTGKNGERYRQTREFGENGKLIRDRDFTDHRRPEKHVNPHQHVWRPNSTLALFNFR